MKNYIGAKMTAEKAELTFKNYHIVMLYPNESDSNTEGEILFAGSFEDAWEYTDVNDPPSNFAYYMLKGINLKEMSPIEVV